MQSALTYILEYGQTEVMINEGIYDEGEVQKRLRAVFGRVDAIRRRIDEAFENDDMHMRRQDMHVLPLPKNFPRTSVYAKKSSTYMDKMDKGRE